MEAKTLVYTDAEWPHGCRCSRCDRLFEDGDAMHQELYAFVDDIPMVQPACTSCLNTIPASEHQENSDA